MTAADIPELDEPWYLGSIRRIITTALIGSIFTVIVWAMFQ